MEGGTTRCWRGWRWSGRYGGCNVGAAGGARVPFATRVGGEPPVDGRSDASGTKRRGTGARRIEARKPPRRWGWGRGLGISGLVAAGVSGCVAHRVASTRPRGGPQGGDDGCGTDPRTAADMGRFAPGAAPIRCEPWDIGTGVRGYVWEAPRPRAALLLQHGYGEYAQRYVTHYNRLVPHLLAAGVSVCAFDLWGHGRSPGRRAVTDVGRAVDDHLAARRTLRPQPLPPPLFVLGHSLGGLVTAASVARDQRGLSGVILSSAFLKSPAGVGPATRLLANVLAAVGPTLPAPQQPAPITALTRIPEERESFATDPLVHHGRLPILLAATGLTLIEENRSRYPAWTVPTLVLHGTDDLTTDPEGSRALFGAIASDDKTIHLVEGGRHELLNDTERDDTLRTLLAWLERRLPPERG